MLSACFVLQCVQLALSLVAWQAAAQARWPSNIRDRFSASRWHDPYSFYHWNALAAHDCRNCVHEQIRTEVPLVERHGYTPAMLALCEEGLVSAGDVYSTIIGILSLLEDTLRDGGCNLYNPNIRIHRYRPFEANASYLRLMKLPLWRLASHPYLSPVLRTMQQKAVSLLMQAGSRCTIDYRLVQKVVRIGMKLLVNKIECQRIRSDWAKYKGCSRDPNIPTSWPDYYGPYDRVGGKSPSLRQPKAPINRLEPFVPHLPKYTSPWDPPSHPSIPRSPLNSINPWHPLVNPLLPRTPANSINPWKPTGPSQTPSIRDIVYPRRPQAILNPYKAFPSESPDDVCSDCRANLNSS